MNRKSVHETMHMLGLKDIQDRNSWVSATCPFGPYLHENGVSTRNSFGISVGSPSMYHCFSCGKSGVLTRLPFSLFMITKSYNPELGKHIYMHEIKDEIGEEDEIKVSLSAQVITKADYEKMYESPMPYYQRHPEWFRGMNEETVKEWDIRFFQGRIVFPWKDSYGRILGAKGRDIRPDCDPMYKYMLLSPKDPKTAGVWFGMHFPLIPKKLLVLVEGEFDAIHLRQSGLVANVWASGGVGITKAQINSLSNMTNPVLFFLDNDKAGIDMKKKLIKKTKGLMQHYEITDYHGCKDASEAYQKFHLHKTLASMKKIT